MTGSRIDEAWKRLESYFNEQGLTLEQAGFYPGVPAEIIPAAEAKLNVRFPADLKESLLLYNGHNYKKLNWLPENMSLLTLDEIVNTWENESFFSDGQDSDLYFQDYSNDGKTLDVLYHPKRLPIAGIDEEGIIYADITPGPHGREGQVILITGDSAVILLADSFQDFLNRYAALLEKGSLSLHREEKKNGVFLSIRTTAGNVLGTNTFVSLITGKE